MRFANVTDRPLDFDLAGVRYQVPAGEVVEVPDRYAYAIALQGIRLVPASEVEPSAPSAGDSVVESAKPTEQHRKGKR